MITKLSQPWHSVAKKNSQHALFNPETDNKATSLRRTEDNRLKVTSVQYPVEKDMEEIEKLKSDATKQL